MKVLLVNKFFYPRGGAENSFFETARLLEGKGHEVLFFSMEHPQNRLSAFAHYFVTNVELSGGNVGLIQKLKTIGRIHYSLEAKRKIEKLIKAERPDIAHLNNISHQISPSIIDSLKKFGIPIVMSLRDYKLTCPVYTLLMDGRLCEECSSGKFYKALAHRCTQGSFLKSAVNMTEMYLHHRIMHIYEKIDEFISPSKFLLQKTVEMGFKGRLNYLPNFIQPADFSPSYGPGEGYIVYVGRLSGEKGVATLIDAMKGLDKLSLKIIGDGPLRADLVSKVSREGINNVEFLGFRSGDELKRLVTGSAFAVIPSEWYENNPRSVLEVFAMGKPVLGARIGGIPELVKDGVTGLLFEAGNATDLAEKIKTLASNRDAILSYGKNARMLVEERFGPETHYKGLMEIYQKAMSGKGLK